jgi:peptidoglycan hydrolase-like protein with peptidoglycan-binding domain
MIRRKNILTAVFLCGSVGAGANGLFAQALPGPNVPKPVPEMPQQTQPTIPGQPAPGLPPTEPLPGQRGTIPERMEAPDAGSQRDMVISSEDIKKAQEALKAKGKDPGAVSGRMHAKTQEALREFQKENNLPATGVLDQKTAEKLGVTLKGDEGSKPQQRQQGAKPEAK